ncbi:exportin-T [[Candida] jaroonii]|uniref:Exportin-T n=1 Tax=[Candida] jaroonii TaxID=467808 RepID=A0ACA9Y4S6_9ASCO|nr:exportin-T [[Candida] jaroonii]
MEQQITQAVEIALNNSNKELHDQAIGYINTIKQTKEGYESCLNLLTTKVSEELRFFIFQVIEENLQNLSDQEIFTLNEILNNYYLEIIKSSSYLKNKYCEILSKIFCQVYLSQDDFLTKWLVKLDGADEDLIDIYLRLMISIHEEIADKLINRDNFINERNTYLKDKIRSNDMNLLIKSWSNIILKYKDNQENEKQKNNLNNALIIVGNYVQWMEISLFIENDMINSLTSLVNKENSQSCITIIEIISKKMNSDKKFQLLRLLDLSSFKPSDDIFFLENFAKLINTIGFEICIIMENTSNVMEYVYYLNTLWPLILEYLANEYDEISVQTFPFIQSFLTLCKKNNALVNENLLKNLLMALILKMKFEDDIKFTDDDLIEEFNEFRTKLKFFQDLIASIVPEVYFTIVPSIIHYCLMKDFGQFSDTEEIRTLTSKLSGGWEVFELGLYEFNNLFDSKETKASKDEILSNINLKLINLPLKFFENELIQINLFEILVKNYKSLDVSLKENHDMIYKYFELFEVIGLNNPIEKIKFRCWYQFLKFIKLIKPGLISDNIIIENLFKSLITNNLLTINIANLNINSTVNVDNVDDNIEENDSYFQNQLYIFEAIGLLISISNIADDFKVKLIDLVLSPVFKNLEDFIKIKQTNPLFNLKPLPLNVEINSLIIQCHHNLILIGTFIKGFNENSVSKEIIDKFHQCSKIILITMENFKNFRIIRESSRFSFARIIPLLNDLIINELNKLISIYLSNELNLIEFTDFMAFINQIIHNYNNENIYNMLNSLITPLVDKIFIFLTENFDSPDVNLLEKMFLNFLSTIVINHKTSILVTESNKVILPQIFDKIFANCYKDFDDLTINKLSITQLINFLSIFKDDKIVDAKDIFNSNASVEGINDYLYKNCINLSFELPFKFTNKLVINEISVLLKTMSKNESLVGVLDGYLTGKINNDLKSEFIGNLIKLDQKDFKAYFNQFVLNMKQSS